MEKLANVDPDALREALSEARHAKAAMRLMVALAYLDGVPVETLSERYGLPRSTIYYWLDRFEEQSPAEAIVDEPKPGRPPALEAEERAALASQLRRSPENAGYDAESWTPTLVRRHVEREFGVSYSEGHARRLLRKVSEGEFGD